MSFNQTSVFKFPTLVTSLEGDGDDNLQAQLGITEPEYINNLVGDVLFQVWTDDLAGGFAPTAQKFIDLLDGIKYTRDEVIVWNDPIDDSRTANFSRDWDCRRNRIRGRSTVLNEKLWYAVEPRVTGEIKYEGMKPFLRQFTYYWYNRNNNVGASPTGATIPNRENSSRPVAGVLRSPIMRQYNEGIKVYNDALDFIINHRAITSGVTLIVDNANNTYTFSVPNTLYLEVGDTVKTAGLTMVTTAVVENVSFTADLGSIGLTIALDDATWEPFPEDDWNPLRIQIMTLF